MYTNMARELGVLHSLVLATQRTELSHYYRTVSQFLIGGADRGPPYGMARSALWLIRL